jgi:hypothetical protein
VRENRNIEAVGLSKVSEKFRSEAAERDVKVRNFIFMKSTALVVGCVR